MVNADGPGLMLDCRKFYTKLCRECADHMTETSLVFTQEMLGKIVRQGYEGRYTSVHDAYNSRLTPYKTLLLNQSTLQVQETTYIGQTYWNK